MPHQNNTIWKLLYSTKEAIQKTRTSEDINSTKRARYSSYNIAHFERFQIICFVTSLSLRICQAFSECCYLYLKIWSKKLSLSMSKDVKCYRRILVCIVLCGLTEWWAATLFHNYIFSTIFLLVVITTAGRRSFLGPIRKNWKSKLEQPDGFARTKSASNSAFFSTVNEKKTLFSTSGQQKL